MVLTDAIWASKYGQAGLMNADNKLILAVAYPGGHFDYMIHGEKTEGHFYAKGRGNKVVFKGKWPAMLTYSLKDTELMSEQWLPILPI